jgi:hypothetical protein
MPDLTLKLVTVKRSSARLQQWWKEERGVVL